MKKQQPDIIAHAGLALAIVALFVAIVVWQKLSARLDAMPTVTTSGHGVEVRR